MIRYHSCYPWHTGGAYRSLMTEADHAMLPWVLEFNKFDLYTKVRCYMFMRCSCEYQVCMCQYMWYGADLFCFASDVS